MLKRYSELRRLRSLEERFEYLSLRGRVGRETFGSDRWINQQFYQSKQWRDLRHHIIVRDNGCDLGAEGYDLNESVYIHHMNPMTVDNITHGDSEILDPEFLISVSMRTHNAIHYGDISNVTKRLVVRTPGDTRLW
jgi:hypothetical protein